MSTDYLRRYTDIPSLVSILTERKITLLDPSTWDDKNDSRFIELYKDRQGLQSVLGLCFTQADETYHHWRVFANGSAGVCIKFDRAAFIKAVKQTDHIRMGTVRYLTLTEIRDEELELSDLPFLKRYPFQDENEFRLIHESRDKELPALDVPIRCHASTGSRLVHGCTKRFPRTSRTCSVRLRVAQISTLPVQRLSRTKNGTTAERRRGTGPKRSRPGGAPESKGYGTR
jgi:hypothetical protein